MSKLPPECNRYARETPYDVLGVSPDASGKELRTNYTRLEREIRESGLSVKDRSQQMERLKTAYDQVRNAANRIQVDFFRIDGSVGRKQCQTLAESLASPEIQMEEVIKPKRVSVSHETLMDSLERYFQEPEKLGGLHHRPMEAAEAARLPPPLEIMFDC